MKALVIYSNKIGKVVAICNFAIFCLLLENLQKIASFKLMNRFRVGKENQNK